MSTSSSEANDESDKKSAKLENGHRVKKLKLGKTKSKIPGNKLKRLDRKDAEPIETNEPSAKEAEAPSKTVEVVMKASEPCKDIDSLKDDAKESVRKEYKTTTVKDMLRERRDRQQLEVDSHKTSSQRLLSPEVIKISSESAKIAKHPEISNAVLISWYKWLLFGCIR